MELLWKIKTVLEQADFSILGHVYIAPGKFAALNGFEYVLVMGTGAVWLAVAAWAVWRVMRAKWRNQATAGVTARQRLLACLCGGLFFSWGAYVTFAYPPTTDEPHYLTVTQSLVADGDIRLSNNYAGKEYTRFYPGHSIDPHAVITPEGEMYSQHTAGVPVMILPFYALAGRWGVYLAMAAVAAALVAALYAVCRRFGVPDRPALACCALAGTTSPLLFASTLVFTEVPAALLLATGLARAGPGWVPAACAAILPWLHPRYALLSLGLAVVCWHAGARRPGAQRTGAIGRWGVLGSISGALFLSVYEGPALVSVLNVLTEKYPSYLEDLTAGSLMDVSFGNPFVAVFGKLFDREFGVIPYAPWLIVFVPGIVTACRTRRFPHVTLAVAGGAYALVTCLFRNWGGSTYPGRTLVPLLPIAVPYLALGVAWALAHRGRRAVFIILSVVSWGTAYVLTICPVLRYTSGREWIEGRMGNLKYAYPWEWFPSFEASPLGASVAAALVVAAAYIYVRRKGARA